MKTGRLLALVLTAVLAFSAAGCGQKAPEATIGVMSSVPESSQAAQTESAAPASESAAPKPITRRNTAVIVARSPA